MQTCNIRVPEEISDRNRLTVAFRLILALPHLILVGGPGALIFSTMQGDEDTRFMQGSTAGLLGVVALVCSILSWFAILFTGRHPEGLYKLTTYYLRWRVRAVAYTALLRDEYPPFGDGSYPAELVLQENLTGRNRLSVAFRLLLAIPHMIVVAFLGIAWFVVSVISWFSILLFGEYPSELYRFAVGAFRWTTRLEAYVLLLTDEYPRFSMSE